MNKSNALTEIKELILTYKITKDEINQYVFAQDLKAEQNLTSTSSMSTATTALAYIGGILIMAGIGIFLSLNWNNMNSLMRVTTTYGVGQILFVYAYLMNISSSTSYKPLCTPLFLMAALFIPTGYFVIFDEFFHIGSNQHIPALIVFSASLVQFLIAFYYSALPSLWFVNLLCYGIIIMIGFDYLDLSYETNALAVSLMLFFITLSKRYSREINSQSPFWFFISTGMFFCSSWYFLRNTSFEIAYILLLGLGGYISIQIQSKVILITSTISMLCYISYVTSKYFANSMGWPITLIILGIFFLLISAGALSVHKKYFKQH